MEKAKIKIPHDDGRADKKIQLEIPGDCDIIYLFIYMINMNFVLRQSV